MKNKLILSLLIAFMGMAVGASAQVLDFGQRSQIGVSVGMMNYSGFMNKTAFTFKESHPSFEAFYRYDVVKNFNVRATFTYGSLSKDNGEESIDGTNRSGQFKTNIFEVSVLPEYNFLDLTTHKVSPYIFMGGGFYSLTGYQRNGADYSKPNDNGFNFRGGIGVRYLVNPNIQIFAEGSRREFSHSIDFYESSNSPSRYYTIQLGAAFRLSKLRLEELW
ncbi:hypothetical protein GCM10027566_31320 [Arachidicoccus ginsenosidivorans]|jgi:hypothetical protein|uniref:Porin family protein n=1 Tax=Arachidicoccus ginsenosidivorans TaxID=496057 RepID=A0A5B8VK72_9BACT|nr:DUF6089 family protein [Arachidicoccus ginsenosidivorans]QEC71365.1 porin family protein [Arachidicoccus ginsenosidivorans]